MKYLIRQGIMSFRTIRKTCATTVWQLAAGKNKDVESCRRLGGLLQALQHRAAPVSEERRRPLQEIGFNTAENGIRQVCCLVRARET